MRDTVPGLDDIHIVAEAGHFVQLEAAEQVNDIMLAFLSRFG
jgi:pimeloyl-ACP methyl ester carboxylesterase